MRRRPTTRAERHARSEAASTWSEFDHVPSAEPRRHLTDEELLLVAVLHRGLLDYAAVSAFRTDGRKPPKDFVEMVDAVSWVHSKDTHPFSFEYCCWQGLGQDPELVRTTVREHWRRLLTGDAATIFAAYTPPKDTDDAGF